MTADNGETKAAEEKAHKLKDLARDYEKQAQAILFAAPIAMLTYTIDKVGTVGLTSCWEWLTWFSWAILALTSVLSGIRLLWIPCTWRARAEEARTGGLPENSTVKANAKAVASGREWWNRQMERGQVAGIALSFLFLFLAHAARSHFDKATITYRYTTPELKGIIERHKILKEARELGIKDK